MLNEDTEDTKMNKEISRLSVVFIGAALEAPRELGPDLPLRDGIRRLAR